VLFGYIARMARAGTIEALNSDYARTAVLKGLPRATMIRRHEGTARPEPSRVDPSRFEPSRLEPLRAAGIRAEVSHRSLPPAAAD
jgi:hypothetical protein